MFLRIWRTRYDRTRLRELIQFARETSSPMFESLDGCEGFVYGYDGDNWITQSFWTTREKIALAEASSLYKHTVDQILASGLLAGQQSTEVFEVVGLQAPEPE